MLIILTLKMIFCNAFWKCYKKTLHLYITKNVMFAFGQKRGYAKHSTYSLEYVEFCERKIHPFLRGLTF